MQDFIIACVVTAALFAVINRFIRGDDTWMFKDGRPTDATHDTAAKWLPGRGLYYAAPMIGLPVGLIVNDYRVGIAFALGYLLWGLPAWGRYFDLGNMPQDRGKGIGWIDWFLSRIDFDDPREDILGFVLRQLYVAPCIVLLAWLTGFGWVGITVLTLAFAVTVETCYAVCWTKWPDNPIWRAEIASGFFGWGGLAASVYAERLLT